MLTTATSKEEVIRVKWEYSPQPTRNLVYNEVYRIFTLIFLPDSALDGR